MHGAVPSRLDAQARDRGHRDALARRASPHEQTDVARLLGHMLVISDNAAANAARGLARGIKHVRRVGARERDHAGARAERLSDVRRLRDARGRPAAAAPDPDPRSRASRRSAFGKYTTACRSRAPRPRGSISPPPARDRCYASASAARRRATCSGCSLQVDRPRQARPLPRSEPRGDAQGGLADRRPARQRHRRLPTNGVFVAQRDDVAESARRTSWPAGSLAAFRGR